MRQVVKRSLVTLFFFFCSLSLHSQKTRLSQELPHVKPGDSYPITLHISGIHYRGEYFGTGQTADVVYADTILNGKRVELRGNREVPFQVIPLGDHQARLVKDPHSMGDTPIFEVYDIVLPNQTVWRCTVTGLSE
jgi:hypothetical protein